MQTSDKGGDIYVQESRQGAQKSGFRKRTSKDISNSPLKMQQCQSKVRALTCSAELSSAKSSSFTTYSTEFKLIEQINAPHCNRTAPF